MPNKSSAADEGILEKPVNFGVELQVSNEVNPAFVNPYRYSKENVKTSYSWSSYKRVSDNIKTGSKGGSITATKTVSFKTEISGPVYGIDVGVGRTESSTKGYKLNADPNSTSYMGYRVRYKVEKGTHVRTDVVTGAKVKRKYTVKTPRYGEYKLIKVK